MPLFLKQYTDCTVDGYIYQRTLSEYGRQAAEQLHASARARLERNARKAHTDIYGNPLEIGVPLITGVSVWINEINKVFHLPEPFRHHHLFQATCYKTEVKEPKHPIGEQGFIVNNEYHVDRKRGLVIARAANQLNDRPVHGDNLFSENVWAFWSDVATSEQVDPFIKVIDLPNTPNKEMHDNHY